MNASSVLKTIFFGLVILCITNFINGVVGDNDGWNGLASDPWSNRLAKRSVAPGGFHGEHTGKFKPRVPFRPSFGKSGPHGHHKGHPHVHHTGLPHGKGLILPPRPGHLTVGKRI